jgi:Holliday junction resolvasome RuvABC endonuclease subunit
MDKIVGDVIQSNKWGNFIVLEYIGKIDKKHKYKVKFESTNNIVVADRASIKRKSVVDKEAQKTIRDKKKEKKYNERKRLNMVKGKEIIRISKNMVKTLSLDQSLNGCAFSYFIDSQLIHHGKIDTSHLSHYIDKIVYIRDTVSKLIAKHKIDILVIEDVYMFKNVEVYRKLSLLHGTLQILAYEKGIYFVTPVAYEWKNGVGIRIGKTKRSYQKLKSVEIVNKVFALNIDDDDIADAICIGYYVIKECVKKEITFIENNWK